MSWRTPAGLRAIGLSHYVGRCGFPMAAYQVHVSLAENESCSLHFALGAGKDRNEATALANQARSQDRPASALLAQRDAWTELLGQWQVKTPDTSLNALLNRWLPYQIISSRLWGRLGFYQASGGFGFRDQLQDVLALINLRPELAAAQIIEAAGAQFEEGDVLHWWHRHPLRGVRTRCSDDLLWLPYVVSQYVQVTRDYSILEVPVAFLSAATLSNEETERYAEFAHGSKTESIYEHCCRAIESRMSLGRHGLPLIGTGDWNDGFSRVGVNGAGESVWLAWFLIEVCRRFEPLCKRHRDTLRADMFRRLRTELKENIESSCWAGEWYLRGFYDDGSTLGGPDNTECRIDLNAQTWAVIAGGDSQRTRAAMKSVREYLIDDEHRLIKLLTPPFRSSKQEPGYIKSYPPGIRENGGQYNHAAAWAVLAAAESGDAELAMRWLSWLNPLARSSSPDDCNQYRIEPYVVAGDVYSSPPFTGRGGWSWYSGSAAWFYRVAMEKLLGIQRHGNRLRIRPCLPENWGDYEVSFKFAAAKYNVRIHDASQIDDKKLIFVEDGQILPGSSLRLRTTGDHDILVFPDDDSWKRWQSADSGKASVIVQGLAADLPQE
jgi:cyclic beta-1,2-glucan synthetase